MPDFDALVKLAMEGNPGPLHHALSDISARIAAFERRDMEKADYPPSVLAMFEVFAEVVQPNGMPKRGQPSKAKLGIIKVYKAWLRYTVKVGYERKRLWAQITKETGGMEIIDGKVYPMPAMKPADIAIQEIAEEFGISEGGALDLIYPDRRKK